MGFSELISVWMAGRCYMLEDGRVSLRGEMTKLKLKFWFGVLKTRNARKSYIEIILTSTEKIKTLNLLKVLMYGILISCRHTRFLKQLFM